MVVGVLDSSFLYILGGDGYIMHRGAIISREPCSNHSSSYSILHIVISFASTYNVWFIFWGGCALNLRDQDGWEAKLWNPTMDFDQALTIEIIESSVSQSVEIWRWSERVASASFSYTSPPYLQDEPWDSLDGGKSDTELKVLSMSPFPNLIL